MVEQGRFTCVGIAHQCDNWRACVFAALTMQLTLGTHKLNVVFELIFLATQHTAVDFDLFFTFAALLCTTALTRKVGPLASETWQIIINLGKFDLQATFTRACALSKDDEDQRRAIKYLYVEFALQITVLYRF